MAVVRNLKDKLPELLKESDFWNDLMDVCEDELELIQDEILKRKFYLYPFTYTDAEDIIEIAKEFGFDLSVEVKDELEYVMAVFKAISFFIKNQGIIYAYEFLYRLIEKQGMVTICSQNSNVKLIREIDYANTVASGVPTVRSNFPVFQVYESFGSGSIPTQNIALEYNCYELMDDIDAYAFSTRLPYNMFYNIELDVPFTSLNATTEEFEDYSHNALTIVTTGTKQFDGDFFYCDGDTFVSIANVPISEVGSGVTLNCTLEINTISSVGSGIPISWTSGLGTNEFGFLVVPRSVTKYALKYMYVDEIVEVCTLNYDQEYMLSLVYEKGDYNNPISTISAYVDGEEIISGQANDDIDLSSAQDLIVAGTSTTDAIEMNIKEVRLYASPLSSDTLYYFKNGSQGIYDSRYFGYMATMVDNIRKVSTVPMIGAAFNFYSDVNAWYDTFGSVADNGLKYTYPTIKTNAAATPYFRVKPLTDPMFFDSTPDVPFDDSILFRFDTIEEGTVKAIADLFQVVKIGIGSKGHYPSEFPLLDKSLTLYAPLSNSKLQLSNTYKFYDESTNDYSLVLTGTHTLTNGVIGKGLYFNGSSHIDVTNMVISDNNKNISMWIRVDSLGAATDNVVFVDPLLYIGFIADEVDADTYLLKFNLNGNVYHCIYDFHILNYGQYYYISVNYDHINMTLEFFVNGKSLGEPFTIAAPTTLTGGVFDAAQTSLEGQIGMKITSGYLDGMNIFYTDDTYGLQRTEITLAAEAYEIDDTVNFLMASRYVTSIGSGSEYFLAEDTVEALTGVMPEQDGGNFIVATFPTQTSSGVMPEQDNLANVTSTYGLDGQAFTANELIGATYQYIPTYPTVGSFVVTGNDDSDPAVLTHASKTDEYITDGAASLEFPTITSNVTYDKYTAITQLVNGDNYFWMDPPVSENQLIGSTISWTDSKAGVISKTITGNAAGNGGPVYFSSTDVYYADDDSGTVTGDWSFSGTLSYTINNYVTSLSITVPTYVYANQLIGWSLTFYDSSVGEVTLTLTGNTAGTNITVSFANEGLGDASSEPYTLFKTGGSTSAYVQYENYDKFTSLDITVPSVVVSNQLLNRHLTFTDDTLGAKDLTITGNTAGTNITVSFASTALDAGNDIDYYIMRDDVTGTATSHTPASGNTTTLDLEMLFSVQANELADLKLEYYDDGLAETKTLTILSNTSGLTPTATIASTTIGWVASGTPFDITIPTDAFSSCVLSYVDEDSGPQTVTISNSDQGTPTNLYPSYTPSGPIATGSTCSIVKSSVTIDGTISVDYDPTKTTTLVITAPENMSINQYAGYYLTWSDDLIGTQDEDQAALIISHTSATTGNPCTITFASRTTGHIADSTTFYITKYVHFVSLIPDDSTQTIPIGTGITGKLEELRVYNRMLNPDEIDLLYNRKIGTPKSLSNMIFYRDMEVEEYYEDIPNHLKLIGTQASLQRCKEEIGYTSAGSALITTFVMPYIPVVQKSCKLRIRTLTGDVVEVEDDPTTGNFVYDSQNLGSVNYSTNTVTISFTQPTRIMAESVVEIDYKTEYPFEYTEAGIFDNEDKCVAYTSFAPIQAGGYRNHVSLNWMFYDEFDNT